MFEEPADRENKNKRKFACFVCGVMQNSYKEFVEHVLTHEQGRDYILCPLARCGAPIRDTRSHFAAKHPSEPVPKIGQMKALIWRDINSQGKIKTRKPKFREGYYESTKMGRAFHYRSSWEATVYELLDSWNDVIAYDVEPFEIPYIHEGLCHNYKPDLFVAFLDGRKEIWEIKPANQTTLEKNQSKWFSAKLACEARGWGFEIYVEQRINQLKNIVKNQHLTENNDD